MATLHPEGIQTLLGRLGVEGPIPTFTAADVQNNPIDIHLSYLANALVQLTGCPPQVAYDSIQWPNELGDLVVVLPRLRLQDKNPKTFATELKQKFPSSHLLGHPVDDGFHLRFFFSPNSLGRVLLPYIIDRGRSYGAILSHGRKPSESLDSERKKIVVEFSSPNLGREFDGLHLRSTIIGAYIASLYESMGWEVTRMNFLGDWGQPLGMLASGWSRVGSEDALKADPLRHLLDVYTKVDELSKDEQASSQELVPDGETPSISAERDANFKALEDGDPDAVALWKRFLEASIERYTHLYARLGIKFDKYSGESEVNHDTVTEVESKLGDKIVYDESKDGWFIDFSVHETTYLRTGHAKIRSGKGTTTYLLRDVAAALDRSRKYTFDKLIYVVSGRQDAHFQQLFGVLELIGRSDLADRLQHISFGVARGLAPQPGESGLLLSDILDHCRSTVTDLLDGDPERFPEFRVTDDNKLFDSLVKTALMTQDLSVRRRDELIFDIPNIGSVEYDTGLDLQSCLTKLSSILKGVTIDRDDLEKAEYTLFEDERYAEVLRSLIQFPATVKSSFEKLESSPILTYLFRLITLVGDMLGEGDVAEASSSSQNLVQLALYESVRQVLENGMRIVGLEPAEDLATREHSGIVPIEPTEESTIDVADEAASEPPENATTEPVEPAEQTATETTIDVSAEPSKPVEAVATEASSEIVADSTQALTSEASEHPPDEISQPTESQGVVEVESEPQSSVAADEPLAEDVQKPDSEALESPVTESTEHPTVETTGDADHGTVAEVATNDTESIEPSVNDVPTTAENIEHDTPDSQAPEHQASDSTNNVLYEPTISTNEERITLPEHVTSIEAH